jgi:hypothetical protein
MVKDPFILSNFLKNTPPVLDPKYGGFHDISSLASTMS